jgi:hypothetical protein
MSTDRCRCQVIAFRALIAMAVFITPIARAANPAHEITLIDGNTKATQELIDPTGQLKPEGDRNVVWFCVSFVSMSVSVDCARGDVNEIRVLLKFSSKSQSIIETQVNTT